ncbi:hypothetical protein [Haloactinomyces albus]|uniref:Uncharacterized protein n=1 Tax=Haloactinomyces albus TaxID=1352928 RepID=A0AAE3ZC40_9ACTN|nr:hypothetical protein [Haloactinomyces albus]MDR7301155.1 hypothetical protein [Haloactinomyces albus]
MHEQTQRLARSGHWAALTGALAGSLVVITSAVALSGTTEAGLTDSEVVLEYTVTGPGKDPDSVPAPAEVPQSSAPSGAPIRPDAPSTSAPAARKDSGEQQRSQVPSRPGDQPTRSRPAGGGTRTSKPPPPERSSPTTSSKQQPKSEPVPCPSPTPSDKTDQTCVEGAPTNVENQ